MATILEKLKLYFQSNSKEKIISDWAESEKYDKVGPTIGEFMNYHYIPQNFLDNVSQGYLPTSTKIIFKLLYENINTYVSSALIINELRYEYNINLSELDLGVELYQITGMVHYLVNIELICDNEYKNYMLSVIN